MSDETPSSDRFLSRWSRRKHEAARAKEVAPEPSPPPPLPADAAPAAPPSPAPEEPLPPVESLTIDSDFTPFLKPEVDEITRRAALRVLLSDPRFNVMDGLDIYIGDYSKPDPMPEGMLAKLADVYKSISEKLPDAPAEEVHAAALPAPAADVRDTPAPAAEVPDTPAPAADVPDTPAPPPSTREDGR